MNAPFIWTPGEDETELWYGGKCIGLAWRAACGWSWYALGSRGGILRGGARDIEDAKLEIIRVVCS